MKLGLLLALWVPYVFAQIKIGDSATTQWQMVGADGHIYRQQIDSSVVAIKANSILYKITETTSDGDVGTKMREIYKSSAEDARSLRDPKQLAILCASRPK